jgi:UDP-3-O-[3-hydroxymyristoyl] glucosamine N-acyltransferase
MGRGARVGAHALIGRDVIVGEDTQIMPHAVLMAGVQVGARCRIFPGAVVGAPGFGHVPTDGLPLRVPQLSNVVIGDDVDVGANSCVDRGALTPTRIGTGCRLDNLVQVAHSAEIAESVMMAAFVGVAGSAQVGAHSRLGARSAVVDGVAVGRDVDLAAATSVTRSVSDGSQMGGTPARPLPLWRREQAALRSLPDLIRQVDHLERQVRQLKGEQP